MPDPLWYDVAREDRLLTEAANRRARFDEMMRTADQQVAMRAAGMTQRAPNASPGLVQAAAAEGVDDATFEQVAAQDTGGIGGFVGGVADFFSGAASAVYEQGVKPLIRGTFTIADTIAQEVVQRPVTAALTAAQDSDIEFGEAYEDYGDSAGRNILQGDYDANDPEGVLGTGFFSGGAAQAEQEAERTLTIDGNEANLGRALPTTRIVGSLFGYDSTAYNTVAGVSQFAADVLTDPLALVTGGGAAAGRVAARAGASARTVDFVQGGVVGARRASRRFDPSEASDVLRAAEEAVPTGPRPVLAEADRSEAAARLRQEAGALSANGRNTVLVEKAQQFFGKPEVLSEIAKADAYTIYQSFRRSSANQLDTRLIRSLGNATNESDVSRVLLDAVQRGQVTENGFYKGLSGFRKKVSNSRLGGTSARGRIDVDDIGDAADKLDSFMRQANIDRESRAAIFNRLVDVEDAPFEEKAEAFFDVVTDAMARVTQNLDGDVETIVEATRLMRRQVDDLREYGITDAGDVIATPLFRPRITEGGVEVATVGPQLTSELAKVGFELPDVTAIRRAAKRSTNLQKLYTNAGWEFGSDALRWATRDLFKPAAILRPAYVLRIGLEEQMRLAAAGYDSLFTHPFRFIQANVMARSADTTLAGDSLETTADAMNVINRRAYNVMSDPVQGRARAFTQMRKPARADDVEATRYVKAWQHELAQLSAAREARWLARNGGDLDGFVDWARNSVEGRATIERITRVSDEAKDLLTDDEAVREWGISINRRLAAKAGGEVSEDGVIHALGDRDILDGIGNGRLTGIRMSDQSKTAEANIGRFLRSKFDIAPNKIKAEIDQAAEHSKMGVDFVGKMNRGVDYLFDTFTGKPTSYLARYPAFRQAYVRRAGEIMGALADDTARTAYARNLDEMFTLTRAEKEGLTRSIARNAGKSGFYDDITELDEVVKLRAAEEVKELLFDVTKRSNVQDAYEVAVPFFDAWAEVTRTWARLVKDNPAFFIKAQQGYQSLRESGVVYVNDFDEEVFAYPGGGVLSSFFDSNEDASLRLEGRVQGANLVAQGVGPGFGPVIQWGVGAFMPDDREWAEIREWLAPFGTGGVESAGDLANPSSFLESFTPAWAKKAIQAMSEGKVDPHQWNSTVGDVMKVLADSGNYDPADPASQQQLMEDAKRGGRWVFALRSLIQGVGLTGPTATWEIQSDVEESAIPEGWDPESDPDGTWHTLGTLGSELHRLAQFYDGDWQMATGKFVEMYGVEPHYITQAKSRSLTESPVTREGDFWMRDHQGLVDRHRAVAGYFVPPEDDVAMDYSVYRRQFEEGDRQSLTPEQQLQLANQAKARSMYYNAKHLLESNPNISAGQRREALSNVRAMIEEQFPNWQDDVLGVGSSLPLDAKIDRLEQAVDDPDAQDSPVTEPLRMYLAARVRLLSELRAQTGSDSATFGRQDAAPFREALDNIGQLIKSEHEAFAGVWSQVLAREVQGG